MKKILSVLMVTAVLMTVAAYPARAYNDVTEPVVPAPGEHVTVGNVNVANAPAAINVTSGGAGTLDTSVYVQGRVTFDDVGAVPDVAAVKCKSVGADASVYVTGNIESTANNNPSTVAIDAQNDSRAGAASVQVGGNSLVRNPGGAALGIYTPADNGGTTQVNALGSVTTEANSGSYGVQMYGGPDVYVRRDVHSVSGLNNNSGNDTSRGVYGETRNWRAQLRVAGNVISEGSRAYGMEIKADGSDGDYKGLIGGDVSADGTAGAKGISLDADGGDFLFDIGGSVYATGGTDATGISLVYNTNHSAMASAGRINVAGDLTVTGNGTNKGIIIDGNNKNAGSSATIQIGGDMTVDGKGVSVKDIGNSTTDIIIDGTLHTTGESVYFETAGNSDRVSVNAWKIDLDPNTGAGEYGAAEQASVHYLIRITQPGQAGAGMALVKEDGSVWDDTVTWTNSDFSTRELNRASENDRVYIRFDIPQGYRLSKAYADRERTIDIVQDANGNYYFVMPRGGGIDVNMEIELIPTDPGAPETETGTEEAFATAQTAQAVSDGSVTDLYFGDKVILTLADVRNLFETQKHLIKRCHFDFMGKKYVMTILPVVDEQDYQNRLAVFMAEPGQEAGFLKVAQIFGCAVTEE
ncbi:MAG: hypothetical protein IKS87_00145 [Lachnospiraceae bacterium]|nr:hypothetical protein [Lachnospiraceae bacterium]